MIVFGDDARLSIIASGAALAIAVYGMDLLLGYGHVLALATPLFVGIGAYSAAVASVRYEVNLVLGFAVAVVVSIVMGILIGLSVRRFADLGLLIVSLLAAMAAHDFVQHAEYFGDSFGLGPVRDLPASILDSPTARLVFVAAVSAPVVAYLRWLAGGPFGRSVMAVGDDALAARSSGIDAAATKHILFVLTSVVATIGGFVYGHLNGYVSPEVMSQTLFLQMMLALFVGGRKTIWAGGAAFVVLYYLPHATAGILQWRLFLYGAIFVAVLMVFPRGFAGAVSLLARQVRSAGRRSSVDEPETGEVPEAAVLDRSGEIRHVLVELYGDDRSQPPPLVADGIGKSFGGVVALRDVTYTFSGPGVTGILGPNGAGKSTLFNILAGEVRPNRGAVRFGEVDVSSRKASARAIAGIGRTFQTTRLFNELTVVENVAIGARAYHARRNRHSVAWYRGRGWWRAALADADRVCRALGLDEYRHVGVVDLPLGVRRLVELGRTVIARPSVLLLDEPASGLDEAQRSMLAEVIRVIGERATVVLVEHDVRFVSEASDRVLLLARGEVLVSGTPTEIRESEVARQLYFGGRPAAAVATPASAPTGAPPVLEIEELSVWYGHVPAVRDATLRVQAGECVIVVGDNGAGKSSLLRGIAGIAHTRGRIAVDGEPLPTNDPVARQRAGVALVPEGRALFRTMSVHDNLLLGGSTVVSSKRRIMATPEWEQAMELFPVLPQRLRQRAGTLSGGEQQMLAIARALLGRPRLVLLDEPGLGLAPQVVDTIYEAVGKLRASGMTVVIAEESGRVRAADIASQVFVIESGVVNVSDAPIDPRTDLSGVSR